MLGGKLAAEVISDRAAGEAAGSASPFGCGVKPLAPDVVAAATGAKPRDPVGIRGDSPIAFGGGQQGKGASAAHP